MSAGQVVEKLTDDAQAVSDEILAQMFPNGRLFSNVSRSSVRGILVKAYTLGWVAGVAFDDAAIPDDNRLEGSGDEAQRKES